MRMKKEGFLLVLLVIGAINLWIGLVLIQRDTLPRAPPALRFPFDGQITINRTRNDSEEYHNDSPKNPYFIFHIGPAKTATTYIQCGLHKLSKDLADGDSYYFVGKTCPKMKSEMENGESGIPGHYLVMGLNDGKTENRGYEKLKARMDYHMSKGNNIIYSNEAFSNHLMDQELTWDSLTTLLEGWNVRVVIGYRHYFDWIRSFYYQNHKQNSNLNKKWPNDSRGKAHPSFLSFLDYHLQRREAGDLSVDGGLANRGFGHHLTISAFNKFSPHFADIRILNLHDYENRSDDLLQDFVCRILPSAKHTCNALKKKSHETGNDSQHAMIAKRPLQSFDAHRIAEAAFEKGYITDASPKEVVVKRIETKIKETKIDSRSEFLACPGEDLVIRLLNTSIAFENEMLAFDHNRAKPLSTSDERKALHVSLYKKSEAEGRFCEVDPEAVLKENEWIEILSKIGKETLHSTSG